MTYVVACVRDQPDDDFRQTLAWHITEEDWNKEEVFFLEPLSKIPDTADSKRCRYGGYFRLSPRKKAPNKRAVHFTTLWHLDFNLDSIDVAVEFKLWRGPVLVKCFECR